MFCRFPSVPPYTAQNNVALHTKRALSLVSRHFRDISIEFMFETVQLFHADRAQLLADTIQSHSGSPARWIKYLMVFWAGEDDVEVMDATLIQLLPHCKNLVAFVWDTPGMWQSEFKDRHRDNASDLLKSIPLGIYVLQWTRMSLGESFHCLRHHSSLQEFRVFGVESVSSDGDGVTIPSLTHFEARHCEPLYSWSLPSLSHLTIAQITEHHLGGLWDTIRSIVIEDCSVGTSDTLPRIIAHLHKLESLSYHISVDTVGGRFEGSWLGVANQRCLTDVYIHCHPRTHHGLEVPSTTEDFFSRHLHPIVTGALTNLRNIHILNARIVFEKASRQGEVPTDQANFLANLSSRLSTPAVLVGFQM
ncbi:hypothetical protein BD410DRAFT_806932 [Rickenella mellea]|uniref:F-box domain-containing protein n=1 Tax=Rickenella mellea TaxID=50990 RepID=A0A4Y7PTQ1_9AGAM|nr:hypothetical protein BD410DRAFT_806932 [Rickenella mellea]